MIAAKSLLVAGIFSGVAWAGAAFAHVELQYPMPRALGQTEGNLKNSPCGQNTDGRTSDRVNVFAPGQTVTLEFNEFIDHPAYYRVAFDPDGDDFPMRSGVPANTVETTAQAEAAEQAIFQGTGSLLLAVVPEVNGTASSATVTLPDTECENCTLQLIEFMYDKGDPAHGYYQCADIALESDATGADHPSGGGADAGASPATTGGSGGAGSAGSGTMAGGLGSGTRPAPSPTGGETAAGVGTGPSSSAPAANSGKGGAIPSAMPAGSAAAMGGSTTPAVPSQPQMSGASGGCALVPLRESTSAGGVATLSWLALGSTARRRRRAC